MTTRRPERQHLPPGLTRRGEPVEKPVRLGPEAATGKRRDVELDAARARKSFHPSLFTGYRVPDTFATMTPRTTSQELAVENPPARRRTSQSAQPPHRIVIQYPAPAVDGGRFPAKRCVGDTVTVAA